MKKIYSVLSLPFFFAPLFTGCTTGEAPVVEGWKHTNAESSTYRVQKEDTIYSIAWAFGMDYHTLVRLNHLKPPYTLSKGQTLRMSSSLPDTTQTSSAAENTSAETATTFPAGPTSTATTYVDESEPAATQPAATQPAASAATETTPSSASDRKPVVKTTASPGTWLWPTQGAVSRGFSAAPGGNKGIDIGGQLGQPIVAVAAGKVVYTGASLVGYGNLIIIKHTDAELSAYAFNKVIAVKEGEIVQAGQTIARMGKNEKGAASLHFEIRKSGKPVDPMSYLKAK